MGYVGYSLGLSAELVKLAGLCTGFFVSFHYYQGLADALASRTPLRVEWASVVVMTGLVVAVYLLVSWGLRLLEKLVKLAFQSNLEQIGGVVFGIVRGVLVASLILAILRQLPSPYVNASIEEHSSTGPVVVKAAPALYDAGMPIVSRLAGLVRPRSS